MQQRRLIALIFGVLTMIGISQAGTERPDEIKRIQSATIVMDEIMAAPDKGIPEEILSSAECVAIVPSMLKGGLIVGGNYGKGVATCRTASGWSAPAPFMVGGASLGFQIGGEAVDLVMVVMNEHGMRQLLSSKFKLGADASVAAGPVGRHAEGSTDWKMRAEVLTYSRARGIFAGVSLSGAVIKQSGDDAKALYGGPASFKSILEGQTPAPPDTQAFVSTVTRYATRAKRDEASEDKAAGNQNSDDGKKPQAEMLTAIQIEEAYRCAY